MRKWNTRREEYLKVIRDRCGHQVQAALRAVRDIAVGEHNLAFAFGNNQFARDMVAQPETLKIVTATLSEFLGRKVQIECQMGDRAVLPRVAGAPSVGIHGDGPDPLVEYADNELGAQVIETRDS